MKLLHVATVVVVLLASALGQPDKCVPGATVVLLCVCPLTLVPPARASNLTKQRGPLIPRLYRLMRRVPLWTR